VFGHVFFVRDHDDGIAPVPNSSNNAMISGPFRVEIAGRSSPVESKVVHQRPGHGDALALPPEVRLACDDAVARPTWVSASRRSFPFVEETPA